MSLPSAFWIPSASTPKQQDCSSATTSPCLTLSAHRSESECYSEFLFSSFVIFIQHIDLRAAGATRQADTQKNYGLHHQNQATERPAFFCASGAAGWCERRRTQRALFCSSPREPVPILQNIVLKPSLNIRWRSSGGYKYRAVPRRMPPSGPVLQQDRKRPWKGQQKILPRRERVPEPALILAALLLNEITAIQLLFKV